ncbi:unnamed protein product, partial [Staurois parvus]
YTCARLKGRSRYTCARLKGRSRYTCARLKGRSRYTCARLGGRSRYTCAREGRRSVLIISLFFASLRPTEEMVKMVLSRPCHPDDQFTTSILRHWCLKHDDPLVEHIKSLLIKNNSLPRKRQSLRSSSSKLAQLTLEQILEHLDNLRLNLSNTKQNFFSQTPILQAPPARPGQL